MGIYLYKIIIALLTVFLTLPLSFAADDFDEFGDEEALEKLVKPKRNEVGVLRKVEKVNNGNKDNKVIVEPRNIIPVTSAGKMEMVPYRMRRKKWGQVWGVSYGLYNPSEYKIDQVPADFSEFYPVPSLGLLSIEATFKRNFDYLTMGIIGSAGYFKTESDVPGFGAELMIVPLKLGFIFELDTLWKEPWVVPYIHGGIYSTYYKEEGNFTTLEGTTLLAFYASGGLMFQIDWLDDSAAREGYQSSGIENTFVFIEANYMTNSLDEKDPGFAALYASAGMKVEF